MIYLSGFAERTSIGGMLARAHQTGVNQTGCGCPLSLRSFFTRATSVRCHS